MPPAKPDLSRLDGYRMASMNLKAECDWCVRSGVVDGTKLWRWYQIHLWKTEMDRVPDHMRCSFCKRRPTRLTPTEEAPTIDKFPRNEQAWQRKVRELRGQSRVPDSF